MLKLEPISGIFMKKVWALRKIAHKPENGTKKPWHKAMFPP